MTKRIISAIIVTPLAVPAGAPPGTPVAQVTIQMSSGLFSTSTGTLAVIGASASDFRVPRLNATGTYSLLSAITIPAIWNPTISLVATQPGIANSQFTSGPYSFAPTASPTPSPPPPPPPPPPSTTSLDGATLLAGVPGSLVTSAGAWTFSALTGAGGNTILLNGQSAAGGSAIELQVNNNGKLYAKNNQGTWFVWGNSSNWLVQNAPPVVVAYTYIGYTDSTGHVWPSGTFPPNVPLGTPVATVRGVRSDGQPYTKRFQFAPPNLDSGGIYSLVMNADNTATLRVSPTGPGVGSIPSFEHVTVVPSL